MDARVFVLGSGTCFPEPGRKRRAHPLFYVDWDGGKRHLLLECSQGAAERLETIGVSPGNIRHLAVSHAHPDHFALPQFVQAAHCALLVNQPAAPTPTTPTLNVYGPSHVIRSIQQLMAIHFEETTGEDQPPGLSPPRVFPNTMSWNEATGGTMTAVNGATLHAFPVHHGFGRCDAVAFRLEIKDGPTIAYSGDTGICDGVVQAAEGANLFICEASARIGDTQSATNYGHLSPRQAGEIAARADAKVVMLTHYSGADSSEAMSGDFAWSGFQGVLIVAKDGMQVDLSQHGLHRLHLKPAGYPAEPDPA